MGPKDHEGVVLVPLTIAHRLWEGVIALEIILVHIRGDLALGSGL